MLLNVVVATLLENFTGGAPPAPGAALVLTGAKCEGMHEPMTGVCVCERERERERET